MNITHEKEIFSKNITIQRKIINPKKYLG